MNEKEKKIYVSLYKKDKLSYTLVLWAILLELVYVISVLDAMEVSFWMGITVMVNIGMLFGLFTCAVKMNTYNRQWAFICLCLGAYVVVRQFVLVPFILKPYSRQLLIAAANIATVVLLVLAGFISISRGDKRRQLQEKLKAAGEGLEE